MLVKNMKTNHIATPLGYEIKTPIFSWITDSDVSKKQEWARVEVALDFDFAETLYDSEANGEISNLAFTSEITLVPRTRYYWRVTVKGDAGDQEKALLLEGYQSWMTNAVPRPG
jgi:alpha-L-rhamnosidase